MQLFRNTKIDFIGNRKLALAFSATLILIGIGSLIYHGGPNYGIDFLGGTSIGLRFQKDVSVGDIRAAVGAAGFNDAEIKSFGGSREVLIRIEQQDAESKMSESIKKSIGQAFPDNPYELLSEDKVGPKIGAELRSAALLAILVALFFILIYISWRFEFVFAIGAIVALFHDVMITLGFFSLLNLELSLAVIAAFLTIVGYSLNDTIVVFDRIRENMKSLRREKYNDIVNISINQSLSRTVVTSVTTMLVVVILYVFGGEVIHDFAFALMVGVAIGTYSSIFIASPILVEWEMRRELKHGKPIAKRA